MIRNFVNGLAILCLLALCVSCGSVGDQKVNLNLLALTTPTPSPQAPDEGSTNEDLLFWALALENALDSANNDKLLIRRMASDLPKCTWFRAMRKVPCDSNNDGSPD